MLEDAQRLRAGTSMDVSPLSLSSENWEAIERSFDRTEKTMDAVAAAGAVVGAMGNPNGAAVSAIAGATRFAASMAKDYAAEQANAAKEREANAAGAQAQREREIIRQIEQGTREGRDRGWSRESMRDYRDPPTREQMDRAGRTA